MLVNRALKFVEHIGLGVFEVFDSSVDELQLVSQVKQPLLLAFLYREHFQLVVEILRVL